MYPVLKGSRPIKQVTDAFYGYNHNLKIGDGEFYDCENMTTDYFPLAASSCKHSLATTFSGTINGMIAKDHLYFVAQAAGQSVNTLYIWPGAATNLTGLTPGKKQLVSMGAYICIFHDGAYYNTKDPEDYGFMGCDWEYSAAAATPLSYTLCDETFKDFENVEYNAEPSAPEDKTLWYKWTRDEKTAKSSASLQQYDAAEKKWNTVSPVYLKYRFKTQGVIPQKFKTGDVVHLRLPIGESWDAENKRYKIFTLLDVGGKAASGTAVAEDDYIVVKTELSESIVRPTLTFPLEDGTGAGTAFQCRIYRGVPKMDFVVECQNRLWGCRYGQQTDAYSVAHAHVNEIYCCALGDFRNWYKYEGISTDSWAASIGSDGEWTGAITFEGHPLFFKENRVHQVTVSAQGAHRVSDIELPGVQSNSGESLCIIGNKLYYKSASDVIEYQGGVTGKISGQLGEGYMVNAMAAAKDNKLYIAMYDKEQEIYVYDTIKRLWSKQKKPPQYTLTGLAGYLAADGERIIASAGDRFFYLDHKNAGAADAWSFESGIFTYNTGSSYKSSFTGGHRYISRFDIRLQMEMGAELEMYIEYDSSGAWEFAGRVNVAGTNSFVIPLRPRRCDHLRFKLTGKGGVKIFSITRNLVMGSDNL